ncbi:MAG TPA: GNAT family N-acetyltransferase, partial [Methylomirabilota bacterium]|nr:GNAT family N-acetyltransferase [Methylomirabilota bacterium]
MGGAAPRIVWPSAIPELVTGRLRLRATRPSDAAALLGILGDPEVTWYHNMPTVTSIAEARAALERLDQRYAARDTIRWAIELAGQGEMVGTAGLLRTSRASTWQP